MYIVLNQGINLTDIKETNSSRVISLILNQEDITRSEISDITQLTLASISKITKKLIDYQLIYESKYVKGKSGRRAIGLAFNYNHSHLLGVKISRGYYQISLFNLQCELQESFKYDYELDDAELFIPILARNIKNFIKKRRDIILISFAVPGPFNHKTGRIELMTEYTYLDQVNIYELSDYIDVPIIANQDANAACLAVVGYYQLEEDSLAYYFLDKGVGAGITSSYELIKGNLGTAGEVGHISIDYNGKDCSCGNKGCLELYCSTLSAIHEINERYGTNFNDIDCFYSQAQNESYFNETINRLAKYISIGALNIINAYNPSIIVFGGEMMKGVEYLEEPILQTLDKHVVKNILDETNIIFSDHSYDFVLYGTAYIGVDYVLSNLSLLFEYK